MSLLLRILAWNIAEGNFNDTKPPNSLLDKIAEHIRAKNPDIVLLSEVLNFRMGVNQLQYLSSATNLPFNRHAFTTFIVPKQAWKMVGILSRYELKDVIYHPVTISYPLLPFFRVDTSYGILEATLHTDGNSGKVRVFSLRFNYDNDNELIAGHSQLLNLVNNVPKNEAVIVGGDFNVTYAQAIFNDFMRKAIDIGLKNAFIERPDPMHPSPISDDYIFYRDGFDKFKVKQMELREITPNPSDHKWVFVELINPSDGFHAGFGNVIKLKHSVTGKSISSHIFPYNHVGTSGQQVTFASNIDDTNDLWKIKGPHEQPDNFRLGYSVRHGDVIRLEHKATKKNLHSHPGFPSPITLQQEVTCYGQNGVGDSNDNWRLEIEGGGIWEAGKRIRLIHINTNHALHSHFDHNFPIFPFTNQQEVTCFKNRDDNDWWYLSALT